MKNSLIHPPTHTNPLMEVTLTDESRPDSVVNIVPPTVREWIVQHVFEHPELFEKDERELWKYLKTQEKIPSPTDNRIRLKFWHEYDQAQGAGRKMNFTAVIAGVCTYELFYKKYLARPDKVAWMLCPPTGYLIKAEEALEFGLEQLRDILEQSHVDSKGRVDTRLGELKAKIVMALDARVKGAVVQKTMNLNVSTKTTEMEMMRDNSMESLQKQLKEVESRLNRAKNLPLTPEYAKPPAKDVDPE